MNNITYLFTSHLDFSVVRIIITVWSENVFYETLNLQQKPLPTTVKQRLPLSEDFCRYISRIVIVCFKNMFHETLNLQQKHSLTDVKVFLYLIVGCFKYTMVCQMV